MATGALRSCTFGASALLPYVGGVLSLGIDVLPQVLGFTVGALPGSVHVWPGAVLVLSALGASSWWPLWWLAMAS